MWTLDAIVGLSADSDAITMAIADAPHTPLTTPS